jgi:g-D-glutamyl-meso-diaminopimelate peptidase
MSHTKTTIVLTLLLIAGVGVFLWLTRAPETLPPVVEDVVELPPPTPTTTQTVIGTSVDGRSIESYTFGTGETDVLFIGGIHGGYEWNTIVLAYEMIDHFTNNPELIPNTLTVHIVPNLNPDGLFEATNVEGRFTAADIPNVDIHTAGIGRFNANNVDLNRNFDCRWSPEGNWRGNSVGTGDGPFSEPEAVAIRDYINAIDPVAAVVWHSRANNVYGAECNDGVVAADTLTLMSTYARAAEYGEVPVFDAYTVTGAIEDWLAGQGIPAVSVELETRTSSEFARNLAGTLATLELYR